jgi:hypothetical protein
MPNLELRSAARPRSRPGARSPRQQRQPSACSRTSGTHLELSCLPCRHPSSNPSGTTSPPCCPTEMTPARWAATALASGDRVVFDKLIQVLVFGCGYRRIADHTCSATTLRRPDRRSKPRRPCQAGRQTLGRGRSRRHPAGRGRRAGQPSRRPAALRLIVAPKTAGIDPSGFASRSPPAHRWEGWRRRFDLLVKPSSSFDHPRPAQQMRSNVAARRHTSHHVRALLLRGNGLVRRALWWPPQPGILDGMQAARRLARGSRGRF